MVLAKKPKPPESENHKKRTGKHHKRTKAYEEPYAPYAPIFILIGLGFALHSFWPAGAGVLAYATDMGPAGLLQATNTQRAKAGQTELAINQQLTKAAQAKAEDMTARNYWSHVTPDGHQPWWFVSNAGYDYTAVGENLAYGFDNSQAAVAGWMNSAGHRANILNAGYRDVGFGIANVDNYQGHGQETIVVALYGTTFSAAVTATAPAARNEPAQVPPTSVNTTIAPATNPAPVAATVAGQATAVDVSAVPSRPVARLQLFAVNATTLSVLITSLVAGLLAGIFIMRHAIFWHRALIRGERFIIRHWQLDMALLAVAIIGVVLTRTAGFIQ